MNSLSKYVTTWNALCDKQLRHFRLRRPLYGWSRSGNIWEQHLSDTLINIKHDGKNGNDKWKPVEHWPQTFWKIGSQGKPVVSTVYVDDFILAGPGSNDEWESIRDKVNGVSATAVGRVFGRSPSFYSRWY